MPAARVALLALIGVLVLNAAAQAADGFRDDFETGTASQPPPGWNCPTQGYKIELLDRDAKSGNNCVQLSNNAKNPPAPFGNVVRQVSARAYRGKQIRLKAAVRMRPAGPGTDRAQLWLRVDREDNVIGFLDNMEDRPITDFDWKYYEIVGDVAPDAEQIVFGCMLMREGLVWLDDVTLEVIGDAQPVAPPEPPRPLTDRGLQNLIAFTKLLGYVRYFHPSDEAAATDWDAFAVRGLREVEGAKDAEELAAKLTELFEPIAPTVGVGLGPNIEFAELMPTGEVEILTWKHIGVGTGSPHSIYSSQRESRLATSAELQRPAATEAPTRTLAGGVSAIVPRIAKRKKGDEDAPTATQSTLSSTRYSANDRAVRLADVALAWNIFQHFYPYFDVVKTDWNAVLADSLKKAATDKDEREFLDTLRLMVAALHDGHGYVSHSADPRNGRLPLVFDWVENQLVITHVADGEAAVKRGEIVRTIDGKPAADELADRERYISGATPQWVRVRALRQLAAGKTGDSATLEIEDPAGAKRTATLTFVPATQPELQEPQPEKVAELRPGIWYVDLDRINDADFQAALPNLERAKGLIFDLRGYPSNLSTIVLSHLIDQPITCARWNIPITTKPDREGVEWQFSNWQVMPMAPRFKGKAAFLTGGGAISYAETYMGMVENYKLAEIVGGPTAGTNGNVNPFKLPGGYMISWTGMKVLKHDGSQHHGIGIQPTVPVSRTLAGIRAGKDEVLEKGIEAVSSPR